jgi:internalin A
LTMNPSGQLVLHRDRTLSVTTLEPLNGIPIADLRLHKCQGVTSVEHLRGMPLTHFILGYSGVTDLTPLKGMKLEYLHLEENKKLSNLEPLHGMPITNLNLYNCDAVMDITPLRSMPLRILNVANCEKLHDLSPLHGMKLEEIHFSPKTVKTGIMAIRNMKSLQFLQADKYKQLPPEEFWKKYDKGEFGKP